MLVYYNLCMHSLVNKVVFYITNSAGIVLFIHIFWHTWINISLSYIHKSRIARSQNMWMFRIARYFSSCIKNYITMNNILKFYMSSYTLGVINFLIFNHPMYIQWKVSILICILFTMNKTLFKYSLAILLLFCQMYVHVFFPFLLDYLPFNSQEIFKYFGQ